MKKELCGLLKLILFTNLIFVCGCHNYSNESSRFVARDFPRIILWAWERPENLEFADPSKYGVAFLAQTLILQDDTVVFRPRRQPLKVAPEAKLIAVTRIESSRITGRTAALSDLQKEQLAVFILKSEKMKNVSAIQIDFDATVSERDFYRSLIEKVRGGLPAEIPLSMTALASFCLGDRWLSDLPVAEAVPMIFRMGADDHKIKNYLAGGNDFAEPLCQKSYGIAIDEPLAINFEKERRIYVFNNRSWTASDVEKIEFLEPK